MQLFFYCNAISDDVRNSRNITGDSPAATRKVFGLCKACRTAGIDARIVSMGRGRVGRFGWHGVQRTNIDGVPTYFGPMLHVPFLSHLLTMAWLSWFALQNIDRGKRQAHLFYNQLTLYLPAVALLNALGHKTYVDIEDAPVTGLPFENNELRPTTGANASPRIFSFFISGGALLANNALAKGTTIRPTLTYYGSVTPKIRSKAKTGYPLNILVSGTLEPATGMTLLAQSLKLIDERTQSKNVVVYVTGQGSSMADLQEVSAALKHVSLKMLGLVSAEDYHDILSKSDVGLSLKLVNGSYADTTFPSKVIEYAENGLMLISTDISDVRAIFGDSASYLTANSPTDLADVIIAAAQNPIEARMLGRQAQHVINERLSREQAGEMLKRFFFGAVK